MMALGTAFAAYLRIFEDCIAYQPTVEHLHSYCRGLLSDLARKSIEPMALACGTAVRTLQEFLRDHVWDHFRMRDRLQQRLSGQPALSAADDLGTIGVIDETSVGKKGTNMILCLVVMGFAAQHTDRLRKKNPEMTMEQVCRALNQRCRNWQGNRRGTTQVVFTAEVIDYHQQRNRAARISRQKQQTPLLM